MEQLSDIVVINNISIQGIQTNSGVFIGDNSQNFWSSHQKSNTDLGPMNGKNFIYKPINYVYDPDYFDHVTLNTLKET